MRLALASLCLAGCASATSERLASDAHPQDIDAPATHHDAAVDALEQGTCASSFTGVLASWDLSAEPGNQASTPAGAKATGITASAITRAVSLTPVSGNASINSSNWATGTLDATRYYAFTITPPSGCKMDLTMASIDAKASGTGPSMAAVATDADAFAQDVTIGVATPSTPTLSVTGVSGAVELRVFGWSASGAMGTFRVQNTLSVTGSLH